MKETGLICLFAPGETITGWFAITEAFLITPPPGLQGGCWTCKGLTFGIDVVAKEEELGCEREVGLFELISVEFEAGGWELKQFA